MNLQLAPRSLQARITLLTLAIFLLGLWSLSWYASAVLREDIQRASGDQQFSMVSLLASEADHELSDSLQALQTIAKRVTPALLTRATDLQAFLDERLILPELFNQGVVVLDAQGRRLAQVGVPRGETPVTDSATRDAVLGQGKSVIGQPFRVSALQAPVFSMAVPIRDARGQIVGVLAGTTNLSRPNFLDRLTQRRYGQTGGFLLIEPEQRLVIAATDKARVMERLPARGVNPVIDRFLRGYEGSAVMVNPQGLEILASDKRIAVSGWIMAVVLPTQEAFAPIVALQQRMLAATLVVTLLAGVLAAWMLRHQLAPVREASLRLRALSDGGQPLLPLPIRLHDEIGQLIAAFNQLVASLVQRERALEESEAFKNGILNSVEAEIAVVDRQGVILAVNDAWRRFGADNDCGDPASRSDIGSNYLAIGPLTGEPDESQSLAATQGILAVLQGRQPSFTMDYPCHAPHQLRWFRMNVTPLGCNAINGATITHTEISALKQAQSDEHFRNQILEMLTQGAPLRVVLHAIVQGLEQGHPGMLCSVLRIDPDGQHLGRVVAPSLPDFFNEAVDGLCIEKDAGSCAAAAFSGQRVVVADISQHSNWEAGRDLAARAGLGACWSEPIRSSSNQVIGVFAIYHREVREPQATDLLLLERSARLAGLAIERSVAADELRASEERFRNLIAWTREAIVVHRNGQIIFVNRAAIDLLGAASEDDLLGRCAMDFVHPDFHPTVHKRLSSLTTLNSATELVEQVYVNCDGCLIRVEVQGTLVNFDGAPAFQLGLRDISAQHAAQQELRIAAIAFECQEAIMVMDAQRRVLRVNRAFTRTTGYAQHEVEGRTNEMMRSERRPTVGDADTWRLMDHAGTFQGELWHRRKDGSDYLARGGATVVRDDNDTVTHYVSIFVDGSAEQQLERQRLLDEASHRNALVREVHHRIKNNLQGVIGLLHRSARKHPELTIAMQQAIGQVHAISVTYGLQGRAITSAVQLDELVRAIARENQILWQNPVQVELSCDWSACAIAQDEAVPIALVLNELILNALKHGPLAQGQVDIRLQLGDQAGAVQVRISNTGQFPSEMKSGGQHSGLQLIAALMPRRGADLLRMQRGDQVLTVLELQAPVVLPAKEELPQARHALASQA